jgi:hypothetical protein
VKLTTRIQSFTVLELTIALLISSIVLGLSYYGILFFNRQFARYKKKSEAINSMLLLKKAIGSDFDKSSLIKDSSGCVLIFDEKLEKRISTYFFSGKNIVRSAENGNDSFFLEGSINRISYISDNLKAIGLLEITVRLGEDTMQVDFEKTYSSNQLMKAEKSINE